MSVDSTSTDSSSASSPIVDFVRTRRQTVIGLLVALGVLALVSAGYYSALSMGKFASKSDSKAKSDLNAPDDLKDKDKLDIDPVVKNQNEYVLAAICSGMFVVVCLGLAAHTALTPTSESVSEQSNQARLTILLAGGLIGLALMIAGTAFFLLWFKSVTLWVDQKQSAQAKFVLLPILIFLLGAGLAFISTGPARVEERNNGLLRRLIYGSNFMLSLFLVGLLLIVLNVFIAVRLPARLDTTSSGVNTVALAESTKNYLLNLSRKLVIYSMMPDDDDVIYLDCKRLVQAAQDVNPSMISVIEYSQTLNKNDIQKLKNRFPAINSPFGILVTIEDDDKKGRFIPLNNLFKQEGGMRGEEPKLTFEGEAKLVSELITLGEGNKQPAIYFTQSARELAVVQNVEANNKTSAERTAYGLKAGMEKSYLELKTLVEDPNPAAPVKIPDDCAVLVIADPLTPLSPRLVQAIREYMTKPRGDKRGRLMVISGAHPSGISGSVLSIGLEELLVEFGISLRPQAIYAQPERNTPSNTMLGGVNPNLEQSANSIALTFRQLQMPFFDSRAIDLLENPPPGGAKAEPLHFSSESRYTWRESEVLQNPEQEFENMAKSNSQEFLRRKQLRTPRQFQILSALSSDETGGRVVVFGTGVIFADKFSQEVRRPINAELVSACCNWLVQRPAAANIAGKTYGQWTPPANVSVSSVLFLPVGIVLMGILSVGVGVWVFRRK